MTAPVPAPRLLAIMGSGETSPTMIAVHGELLRRLGPGAVPAVLLDTPFGFQLNADEIAMRAVAYFRQSVERDIGIASLRRTDAATPFELETFLARIAEARYVFAGPGSPTYALRQWLGTPVVDALREKLLRGGCLVFASAAAVGLGALAIPVYEVYKVGEDPVWTPGLDLLSEVGISAAVVPHFNNAEGGTHDTRYCYMGLRRIRQLEEQLPPGMDIIGVDEHTACIFDLDAATVSVRGRGTVTLRRQGMERRFEAGRTFPVAELGPEAGLGGSSEPRPRPDEVGDPPEPAASTPFAESVADQCRRAEAALAAADPARAVEALLALESELSAWAADTLASDERDRARGRLRQLMVRLGELAREGAVDPRVRVAPFVEGILRLRREARDGRRFEEADRLRELLLAVGVEVRDAPSGTEWVLGGASPARLEV